MDFFDIIKKIGSKILDIVKNAPILLIFGVWNQLIKSIAHTKFEPNRSIFDDVQKFGPRSKFLKIVRFGSNSVWAMLLVSWFHTPNMSKIGAFLTMSKILDPIILTIQKNEVPNFWYVAIKRLIYLKRGPKSRGRWGHWDPFLIGLIFSNAHCADGFGPRPKLFD